MQDVLSRWEAAEYLTSQLGENAKHWYGYLHRNVRNSSQQHGYKISAHVLDGDLVYTRFALQEFVRVSTLSTKY